MPPDLPGKIQLALSLQASLLLAACAVPARPTNQILPFRANPSPQPNNQPRVHEPAIFQTVKRDQPQAGRPPYLSFVDQFNREADREYPAGRPARSPASARRRRRPTHPAARHVTARGQTAPVPPPVSPRFFFIQAAPIRFGGHGLLFFLWWARLVAQDSFFSLPMPIACSCSRHL